jgi:spermidine/putrescine transport system permease protein
MTRLRSIFVTPAAVLMLLTVAVPVAIICVYSFLSRGAYGGGNYLEPENYSRLIDPLYGGIFLRSFALAGTATALCILPAFPLALFIAQSGTRKNLYLSLVILPFWTSFLIRLYAWMFLLRDTGLINTVLQSVGLIRDPLPLLYNNGAVLLGLVYGFLPFAVLPIYATLERLDKSLLEAAADLGARPWAAFFRVIVPLAKPGIWAGTALVFITCLGAYSVRICRRQQDPSQRQFSAESVHHRA